MLAWSIDEDANAASFILGMPTMNRCSRVLCVFLVSTLATLVHGDWGQFRGPAGDGVSTESAHPLRWSEQENITWKRKIEGVAWSQPIALGDKALLTTALAEGQERPRPGEAGPGFSIFTSEGISRAIGGGAVPEIKCKWKLICLDLATGSPLWETIVREGQPAIPIHRSNSHASETPVSDGEHVYVYLTMVGVYCFDLAGREIWNQPVPAGSMQFGWGGGSSPLLVDETLYVVCDKERESFVIAFDKRSGEPRWRVAREERSNWATPYLWRNRQQKELVLCGGSKTRSYSLESGELFWELRASGRGVTTAVGDADTLFVGSSTRTQGLGGTLHAIRAGASGDLSQTQDGEPIVWRLPKASPQVASPLLYKNCLYTLRQQSGILCCLNAETGEQYYRRRLPGAGGFTASPWAAGGYVFCLDEKGQTFVIAPGPEFQLVATNRLDGMFWSSPAIQNEALLLRSVDHLYKISAPTTDKPQ